MHLPGSHQTIYAFQVDLLLNFRVSGIQILFTKSILFSISVVVEATDSAVSKTTLKQVQIQNSLPITIWSHTDKPAFSATQISKIS